MSEKTFDDDEPVQDCQHPNQELRLRTLSNGATALHKQCLDCGEPTSPAIKKSSISPEELAALPPFDTALRDSYRQQQHERAKQAQVQWASESPARKAEYAAYLKSPQWWAKRNAVMKRDNYVCQGCLSARASEVHHLTYDHRGDELLYELTSLCTRCHERAHAGRTL